MISREKKQNVKEMKQKQTYTNISFKVRTKDDKDILDILNSVPNKSEFLKALIRASKAAQ